MATMAVMNVKKQSLAKVNTEIQYRGLVRNLLTNEYDVLFHTVFSEILCYNRTLEKANLGNKFSKKGMIYDVKEIVIQSRVVESYATEWQ